jgi:hypothetical protein
MIYFSLFLLCCILGAPWAVIVPSSHHVLGGLLYFHLSLLLAGVNPSFQKNVVLPFHFQFILH